MNRQYLSAGIEIEHIVADKRSCVLTTKTKRDPWGEKYRFRLNTYRGTDGGMLIIYSKGVDGIDCSANYASNDYGDDIIAVVQPKRD